MIEPINLQQEANLQVIRDNLKLTSAIDGNIAEIGIYQGGSALIIADNANINKKIFLCDTFEGIQDWQDIDNDIHNLKNGDYTASYYDVLELFKDKKNIYLIKGYFPNSATQEMINSSYSLVHLDTDTYESTKNSLNFFYPRLNIGGKIICHDYGSLKGVTTAVDNFCKDTNVKLDIFLYHQVVISKIGDKRMGLTFSARDGSQRTGLEDLCKFVKDSIGDNLNIVEVGSYCGASASIIASIFTNSKINCVDPWEKYVEDCSTYDLDRQALELKEAEEIFDKVVLDFPNIQKNKISSTDYAKTIENETLDFIYIDGNHQYSSIKEDIQTWLPKIKPNGMISGHDYSWPSVQKAILEVFGTTPHQVFIDASWVFMKDKLK